MRRRTPAPFRARAALALGIVLVLGTALAATAAFTATAAASTRSARAAPALEAALRAALAVPGTSLDRTAAIAIDLRTGEPLFEHRADAPMIPASNEKLPVTFAALRQLGPEFVFRTDVVGVGERRGATWEGDLVLVGYGDPTFDTAKLERLVATLKARGLRAITGDVRADESYLDREPAAPGWKPSFVGDESGPLTALVLDRGRAWDGPGTSAGLQAARAFAAALAKAGIAVGGATRLGAITASEQEAQVLLAEVESAPLAEIAAYANTESDNYVAEMILKQLGTLDAQPGTTAAGAAVVLRTLTEEGIPTAGLRIVDGSGLSRLDRLTPRALIAILRAGLSTPAMGAAFRRSLAVAGRTGTLEHRLPTLHGKVRGKTGTTSLACALTGLLSSRIGFSILENGDPQSSTAARAAQDRFLVALARLAP